MSTISAVDLQGASENWSIVRQRRKRGRHVCRQTEKRERLELRGILNIGTMIGKASKLADVKQRRKVDILGLQETMVSRLEVLS